jgi:hypothetical protein
LSVSSGYGTRILLQITVPLLPKTGCKFIVTYKSLRSSSDCSPKKKKSFEKGEVEQIESGRRLEM